MFLKRIFRRFFTLLFVKSNVFFLLKSKLLSTNRIKSLMMILNNHLRLETVQFERNKQLIDVLSKDYHLEGNNGWWVSGKLTRYWYWSSNFLVQFTVSLLIMISIKYDLSKWRLGQQWSLRIFYGKMEQTNGASIPQLAKCSFQFIMDWHRLRNGSFKWSDLQKLQTGSSILHRSLSRIFRKNKKESSR